MCIDPKKVDAIRQTDAPQCNRELGSFQHMVNYLKVYSSQLTQLAEPVKRFWKSDTLWCWETKHPRAFEAIKDELTKTQVLTYFDPKADHIKQVDGSMKGLGVVLHQKGRPVICASRTLTPAETGDSSIEREFLSVVFGLERLYHYVCLAVKWRYRLTKSPLIPIWEKSVPAGSPWIQCLLLRLENIMESDMPERQGQCHSRCPKLSHPTWTRAWRLWQIWCHSCAPHNIRSPTIGSQLEAVGVATQVSLVHSQLRHQIFQGWWDAKSSISDSIYPY